MKSLNSLRNMGFWQMGGVIVAEHLNDNELSDNILTSLELSIKGMEL